MSQPWAIVLNKMPSIFLLFVRRTENNVFWPTGWVGGRKKSVFFITDCVAKATMTFHFPAPCRANIFRVSRLNFLYSVYRLFHVYRQCSPVQIKYVSFADKKNVELAVSCISSYQEPRSIGMVLGGALAKPWKKLYSNFKIHYDYD